MLTLVRSVLCLQGLGGDGGFGEAVGVGSKRNTALMAFLAALGSVLVWFQLFSDCVSPRALLCGRVSIQNSPLEVDDEGFVIRSDSTHNDILLSVPSIL